MKIFSFSLFLLLMASGHSYSLTTPTSTQMQALQTQLTVIQILQGSAIGNDPQRWTGIAGLEEMIRKENTTIDPNVKQLAAWKRQLDVLKPQLAPLCQKLLEDTYAYYGIKPNRWSAELVTAGKFNRTRATWRPRFGEWAGKRAAPNGATDKILMLYPWPYSAITWENGDIIVTIDAFRFSPGYLAAVIKHETIHFDQITTAGRGDKMSPAGREFQAYSAMLGFSYDSIFNLSPAEKGMIQRNYEDAIKNSSSLQSSPVIGGSGFYSVNLTENPDGEDLLRKTLLEAEELASKHRERIELDRQRDHDERLKMEWAALARRSCDNPGSVSQSELDALPRLHDKEPLDVVMLFGNCNERVYYRLHAGESAEAIAREARPVGVAEPPRPLPPVADAVPQRTFESVFANLQFFAEMACKYGGHFPTPGDNLLTPRGGYTPKHGDDEAAAGIAARLGRCEGHVFRSLYAMLREGRGNQITKEWFIGTVARTPAPPSNPPPGGGQVSPPTGGYVVPPKGTNPCERNGDPFGCQPRR